MEPFLGQIIMFAGNFNPRGWALCNGQLLAISQYSALFSILGTTYGGDGRTTFGLPDLRGRVPIHAGSGPGLTPRTLGSRGGSETNTLNVSQLPSHTHAIGTKEEGNTDNPDGAYVAGDGTNAFADTADGNLLPTSATGANQSVNNMQPFQSVNFIIALEGTFPSRN